jgi:hypothetical protein
VNPTLEKVLGVLVEEAELGAAAFETPELPGSLEALFEDSPFDSAIAVSGDHA